jgi:predicted amidophosphoribosyltransferase
MKKALVGIGKGVLDILFPQKQVVRELERMDPFIFAEKATRTEGYAGKDIISLFSYTDPSVRTAIWELKYRGNTRIARLLAAVLHDELIAFLEEYAPLRNFTDPLLVPIPLSKQRRAERGFNQCELLCEELAHLDASRCNLACPPEAGRRRESGRGLNLNAKNFTYSLSAIRKMKDTPSQTKAESREKRMENLKGCFAANEREVRGRNIILIDDVATTGATLDEAKRALRNAEAKKVIAFTIAH